MSQDLRQILVIGVASGSVYALFALGVVLVYKTTRVLNLAQAEVGTLSAFIMYVVVVEQGQPWLLGAAAAVVFAAVLGVVFERLVARPLTEAPRLNLVVATAAVASVSAGIVIKIWGTTVVPVFLPPLVQGGGVEIASVTLIPMRLIALGVALVVAASLALLVRYTTFGLALLAMAQDPVGVRLTGIRARYLSSFVWAVAFALGSVAVILTSTAVGTLSVLSMTNVMLMGFAAAVVGGMRSLPGAVLGGLLMGILNAAVSKYYLTVPGAVEAITFVLIVVVLIARPQGILGRSE